MGQLMSQHTLKLILVQEPQNALGDSHHRMLGIAACGKGIGGFRGHDANLGYGKAGLPRQLSDHTMQVRGLCL